MTTILYRIKRLLIMLTVFVGALNDLNENKNEMKHLITLAPLVCLH